jgi:serine/threonine protein kinase
MIGVCQPTGSHAALEKDTGANGGRDRSVDRGTRVAVTPSLPLVGQDFAGYRLQAVIGRGGMSVVYRAENVRLGNTIALKVLAPELSTDDALRTRFVTESRLAASLNHPNVIPIYDSGACGELLYIAMRYVAGSDLRAVLDTRQRISPEQALLLVGQAGRALDAAHRLGLVHRDVKPGNILIEQGAEDDPDHVYMADFGITKQLVSDSGLTVAGHLLGTADYVAPEQIQHNPVDGRADIYSLGCVLYECLTGQVPFVKDLDAAVLWAHVEEAPAPPSSIRAELRRVDDVLMRALAKDPNDRYPTCREFLGAARAALDAGTRVASSPGTETGVTPGPPTVLERARGQENTLPPAPLTEDAFLTPVPPDRESHGYDATVLSASPEAPENAPTADSIPDIQERPGPDRDKRTRGGLPGRLYGAALVLLVGGAGAAVFVTSSSAPQASQVSTSTLERVPTNDVTGSGSATVRLEGDVAKITVTTSGLDKGSALVHAMHIYAGGKGECPPASAAERRNGHLTITTTDGAKYFGTAVLALTTRGDTSPASILKFSRYPTGGNLNYARTIKLTRAVASDIRRNNAVVVVDGISDDEGAIYSGVLGRSELDASLPATATAPALCGPLRHSS